MNDPVRITPQGELELVITRSFAAPRRRVFEAWTQPEHLRRWLGIQGGWIMPICSVDLRVGGEYRYEWRSADGAMGVSGAFLDVQAPERLVATERFDTPWYPGGALITHTFEEDGEERTRGTMTIRYDSREARDLVLASPMQEGMEQSFRMLDALLAGE